MCGTLNDQNAQSCKYCGYLFEDYSSTAGGGVQSSASSPQSGRWQAPAPDVSTIPPIEPSTATPSTASMPSPSSSSMDSFQQAPSSATSTATNGTALFVVNRSLLSSLVPSLAYLVFLLLINGLTSFDIVSVGLLVVFALIAVVPVLFSPRKYEFYDNALRIHKIVGGDIEIPYSDLTLYDSPAQQSRRREQIVLQQTGKGRPLVIPGNPTNSQLGQNLKQFLGTKLKKQDMQFGRNRRQQLPNQPASTTTGDSSSSSQDTDATFDPDTDAMNPAK